MSEICIRRKHGKTASEARTAAERLAGKLEQEFGLEFGWQGEVLCFARPGVSGEIAFAGEDFLLTVRLGLLLSPLQASVEQEINRILDQALAA